MTTPAISGAEAEQIAHKHGAIRDDNPPLIRFSEGTKEDRNESIKQGRLVHLPTVEVFIKARGDTKCEVPDVVEGWAIETKPVERKVKRKVYRHVQDEETGEYKEIEQEIEETIQEDFQFRLPTTPWFNKLKEKLHHGFISQHYYDYCHEAYKRWKDNREMPLDGTPVVGWNQVNMAMQKNMVDIGINTIEKAAEMTEDAMDALGMGSREVKKIAIAYVRSSDTGMAASEMKALQEDNARLKEQGSAFQQKLADLQAQIDKPKRGRPRKE